MFFYTMNLRKNNKDSSETENLKKDPVTDNIIFWSRRGESSFVRTGIGK